MRLYLAVGCGAALGALLRFLTALTIVMQAGAAAPVATGVVNVIGSFVIVLFAVLTGPDGRLLVSTTRRQFVMAGLCGGYTTFSAMSLDTFLMVEAGHPLAAAGYLATVIGLSLAAAWAGRAVGIAINR